MKNIPSQVAEFYKSLENLDSLNIWDIQKELCLDKKIKGVWRSRIITERKVLLFELNRGRLLSNVQLTNSKGKITQLPIFLKPDIKYLQNRLDQTSNIWLKSRYAHLLWQETKHLKYAEIAIEYYIKTIDKNKSKEYTEIVNLLSAILFLAKNTKKKINEAKQLSIELIDFLPTWQKAYLINAILENNIFYKKELLLFADKIISWVETSDPSYYFNNKYILEIAINLFNKLQRPLYEIYDALACNEDFIINQHPNDKDFIKFTATGTKAKYLKKARQKQFSEDVFKEYNRLKQKVELGKFSFILDEKHTEIFNQYLNMISEAILKLPSESVLAFFSINEDILVDPKLNESNSKVTVKKSIQNLFTISVFDINSNFKMLTEKDKLDREIIKNYAILHTIQCYSLFLKVFINGILSGKLNYYKVYDYLEKHTWYGTKFKRNIAIKEIDKDTTWLTMLAPGIHNLLTQFELSILLNTNKINNFILSIDSLTLKFEGALRDFIKLSGGNTTKEKNDEIEEQLLEELLENSKTKEFFTEKDIELFKFTFTKKGKNLRNIVAHSFMEYSDYSLETAFLIFFCIIRLGKYTFVVKKENNAT